MSNLLSIDADKAVEQIRESLSQLYRSRNVNGILIGLSGGIDSSVLTALSVRALGNKRVKIVYLYDRFSLPKLRKSAQLVADWLNLKIEERSIEPALHDKGVYTTFGMRLTSVSGTLNRVLVNTYRWIYKESPFLSSLRKGQTAIHDDDSSGWNFRSLINHPEDGINIRHCYRRKHLEDQARAMNLLPIGAANLTEWQLGWFVKDGIDDLPIQPLKGLYKTQVRQLACYLNVPMVILDQSPSPDMVPGINDEFGLGLRYDKIDLILDHLDGGLSLEVIYQAGCRPQDVRLVMDMKKYSQWKRSKSSYKPPVDGTVKGSLRLQA